MLRNISKDTLIEIGLVIGAVLAAIDMFWPTTYPVLGVIGVILIFVFAFIRFRSVR